MKQIKKIWALPLLATLSLGLTGCKDDVNYDNGYDDSKESLLLEGAPDITFGKSNILLDIDQLGDTLLSLGTRKNVSITFDNEKELPIEWELRRDEDGFNHVFIKRILETRAAEDESYNKGFNMSVKTLDGRGSKNVRVVFRRKLGASVNPELTNYYYQSIGRSLFPWQNYGDTYTTILDSDYLPLELGDASQSAAQFEIGGTRYDETIEKFSAHIGLSFKAPGKTLKTANSVFNGGVDVGVEGMASRSMNCEYYLGYVAKIMGSARIGMENLAMMLDSLKPTGSTLLSDYLTEPVNKYLNDSGSDLYKRFKNDDKESMYALLTMFGTHVLTSATFGGSYIYSYCRMENAYETSIAVDASAKIKKSEKAGELEDFIDIWKAKNGNYLDNSVDVGYYSDDYEKVSRVFSGKFVRGGNVNSTNIDVWDQSFAADNTAGWELTKYTANDMDTIKGANLIPIYEFITDSARRASVKAYFASYIEDKMNKDYPEKEDWPLILADFKMKDDSHGGHDKGHGESFTEVGPDNNTYLYLPVMANKNFPIEKDRGYPLETCQAMFVNNWSCLHAHYWYYALGYYHTEYDEKSGKEVNVGALGFKDLALYDENKDKFALEIDTRNWVQRGNHSNEGVGASLNNNYVYIDMADNETDLEDLVRSVVIRLKDGPEGEFMYIGSTGGSEWQYPWTDANDEKLFYNYWENHRGTHGLFYEYSDGPLDYHLSLGFSRKASPVQKNGLNWGIGGDAGKIQNPHKWKDPLN